MRVRWVVSSRPPKRQTLSLKGRALKLLSQREHSEYELAQKLARFTDEPEQVQAVVEEFRRLGFLSNARFAESLARRRGIKLGSRAIAMELGEHRLNAAETAPVIQALQGSELERAQALWRRRFGEPPRDLAEKGKQARYLIARGFPGEVVSRVVKDAARGLAPEEDGM